MTISNNFKILALSLTFFSFISCSNDDGETDNSSKSEAIVKIELTHSSNFTDFEESLNIQIIADNAKDINVTGETWDNIEYPDSVAKWFLRYGEITSLTRTFVTSEKVKSLTIATVHTPNIIDTNNTGKLTTVVKVYVNDKLIKTENFNSSYGSSSTFTVPVDVQN
jgi:hypothetical protein